MKIRPRSALFLAAVLAAAVPCSAWAGEIRVESAWVREAPPMARATGVFMTIKNLSDKPDRLTRVESPAARAVEIHETRISGDMATMEPAPFVEIPAKGEVVLKPGGLHVMLIDPKGPIRAGETVPITLVFENAGRISIEVSVRKMEGSRHGEKHHGQP